MEIKKVVLTGGPCAGKTTAVEALDDYLKEKNIPTMCLPEVATKLIKSGFKPNEKNIFKFQKEVIGEQLLEERKAVSYLKDNYPDRKIGIIICDRGIFDNRAYLDSELSFDTLLKIHHLSEIKYLDSYDMVLDLLSTATCKPKSYTLKNNKARMEGVSKAIELDKKTSNAWSNHYNMKVLSSRMPLKKEIAAIKSYVDDLINGVNITYINRFLIDVSCSNIDNYLDRNYVLCEENYLDVDFNGYTFKLTSRRKHGVTNLLEVYKEIDGKRVTIYSKIISQKSADALKRKYTSREIVCKSEKGFVSDKHLFKLCYHDDKMILEVYRNNYSDIVLLPKDLSLKQIPNDEFNANDSDGVKVRKLLTR